LRGGTGSGGTGHSGVLPSIDRYARHHRAAVAWLRRSLDHGRGGSAAYYLPPVGWAAPYPETTGYLIPTLLDIGARTDALTNDAAASWAGELGRWLVSIQNEDGSWYGGRHPPKTTARPSVFNTGQIVKGMVALHRVDDDGVWLSAAVRAVDWLRKGMQGGGLWSGGDYLAPVTPSYYTEVLWPMLEVWAETGDDRVRLSVEAALEIILGRARPDGEIDGWAFAPGQPAFTHTIAYTLRGLQECARLLDAWDTLRSSVLPAVEVLLRRAELRAGRLPGAFDTGWRPSGDYVCLTGNAQVALCLLILHGREPDLRLVSGAARMIDVVCEHQVLGHPLGGVRGGIAGSAPLSGAYMRFRYPNWAAKYFCDAIQMLLDTLDRERMD
jgi:hypothetical protein